MPIAGATIFSMKISNTAKKLGSVVCVAFLTCVFHQTVGETKLSLNASFAKVTSWRIMFSWNHGWIFTVFLALKFSWLCTAMSSDATSFLILIQSNFQPFRLWVWFERVAFGLCKKKKFKFYFNCRLKLVPGRCIYISPLVFVEICCLHNQNPTNRGGCLNASHRYLNFY